MDAGGAPSDARLRELLGELDPGVSDPAGGAWVDGFGIVVPDVQRYADVLLAMPDAVQVALRNVAAMEGLEPLDAGATTLLGLLTRSLAPTRVLEVGTSVGHVTLHLARAVPPSCIITSIDADPVVQGHAHAFLERDAPRCAVELRLGDPLELLASDDPDGPGAERAWGLVVLTDANAPRQALVDVLAPRMAPGALLVVPGALRGGRVADTDATWDGQPAVEAQRSFNRALASDARFTDVQLLPVGDGLLLGRRTT